MFQLQNIRREKFDKTMDEATEYYVEYERLVAKASPVKYLLNAAPTLICIMVGFINSYQGKITSGEFVSVVLLLEYISKPLSEFLTNITDYKTAQVSMERVLEILEYPLERQFREGQYEIGIDEKTDKEVNVTGNQKEELCFGFEKVAFG